jgi:hypothetical protein
VHPSDVGQSGSHSECIVLAVAVIVGIASRGRVTEVTYEKVFLGTGHFPLLAQCSALRSKVHRDFSLAL